MTDENAVKIKELNDNYETSLAKNLYRELEKAKLVTPAVDYEHAESWRLSGHFDRCLKVLQKIEKHYAEDREYCYDYGWAYQANKKYEIALEWFNKAKEMGLDENPKRNRFSVSWWIDKCEEEIKRKAFKEEQKRRKEEIKAGIKVVEVTLLDEVVKNLWDNSEYSKENYIGDVPADLNFELVERKLKYKLPEAYKTLMKMQNGGILNNKIFINGFGDEFSVKSIYGVDSEKKYSLLGERGSRFWIEHWEYPKIGIVFAEDDSGGHGMYFLDYSDCGKKGEPSVVYIDQENDFEISYLADNFASFINGLKDGE